MNHPYSSNLIVCTVGAWSDYDAKAVVFRKSAERQKIPVHVVSKGEPWKGFIRHKILAFRRDLVEIKRNRKEIEYVLYADARDSVFTDDLYEITRRYRELHVPGKVLFSSCLPGRAFPYGSSTEWMMFIDSDEFLFGTTEDDLRSILERYEKNSGVAVHWKMFGANNHVIRPPTPSIKHFTHTIPESRYVLRGVKSIVKPRDIRELLSPHLFLTTHGTVREHFDPVDCEGIWQCRDKSPTWDILRCNHYNTRSMEDWVARRKRGSCNDFRLADNYNVEHFYRYQNETVEDLTIQRFVPALKLSKSGNSGIGTMRLLRE